MLELASVDSRGRGSIEEVLVLCPHLAFLTQRGEAVEAGKHTEMRGPPSAA